MTRLLIVLLACLTLSAAKAAGCGAPGEGGPSNCGDEVMEVSDRVDRMARWYGTEIHQGRLRERTNLALNAMVRFAAFKLRAKGHKIQANKLINEWEGQWSGYLMRVGRDLGDHRPLSQWLAEKYAILEFIFGTDFMEFTRLVDLKIINFGIPVVFSCVDNVDEVEFEKHFVPLGKVTVYWSSFFVCVGGTWGTGFLFCSPISWGLEFAAGRWVLPPLNRTVWEWSCQ